MYTMPRRNWSRVSNKWYANTPKPSRKAASSETSTRHRKLCLHMLARFGNQAVPKAPDGVYADAGARGLELAPQTGHQRFDGIERDALAMGVKAFCEHVLDDQARRRTQQFFE